MRILISLILLLVVGALPCAAQPARDRVLGDIEITEHAESAEVRVGFNFPIRYLRHFPEEKGRELRVQLAPIEVGKVDRDALFLRETQTPPQPNLAGISEVVYEGDTHTGFYLSVYFQGEAHWQVSQGNDFRSLEIRVLTPYPSSPQEKKSE